MLKVITEWVKEVATVPVIVKLTPNITDVTEPALAAATAEDRYQFEREGYFCLDSRDSASGMPVFNRTVTLKDTWAKLEAKGGK